MRDLAIAYRIYPGVSKAPAFHANSKFDLSRFCLQTFRQSLGKLSFKIWAILDDCPPEYADLFRSVFSPSDLEIVETPRIGNARTFSLQIDLLRSQQEADLVFFAEDDYFYWPNALMEMVEFARSQPGNCFVTPYDHPDDYATSSQYEKHRILAFGKRHWRQTSSTCLTFLTSQATLASTESVLRTYTHGNMDCSMWLSLTQKGRLSNPRVHAANTNRLKIWAKAWIWGWRNILFSKSYSLWAPLPTLATHMESTGLAPVVPWFQTFQKAERAAESVAQSTQSSDEADATQD